MYSPEQHLDIQLQARLQITSKLTIKPLVSIVPSADKTWAEVRHSIQLSIRLLIWIRTPRQTTVQRRPTIIKEWHQDSMRHPLIPTEIQLQAIMHTRCQKSVVQVWTLLARRPRSVKWIKWTQAAIYQEVLLSLPQLCPQFTALSTQILRIQVSK